MKKSFVASAMALALCAGVAAAQCTVGPTAATLRINGAMPSSNAGVHVVAMPTGDLTLSLTDGGGFRPFFLLSGVLSFGATPVPLGCGALDLASPQVLLDGIFLSAGPFDSLAHTDFTVSVTVAAPCSGYTSPGFQTVFLDNTAFPFPYNLSEAGAASQPTGAVTSYTTVGDDVFVTHPLQCPVTYAGTMYTQMFLGSNGMVTFTSGSGDFSATNAEFFNGFRVAGTLGSNPGVAVMWGDYFRSTNLNDAITVTETPTSTNVAYTGQQHWDTSSNAGDFSVTFDTSDQVMVDLTLFVPGMPLDTARITGVTDGTDAAGTNTVLDISASQGGYVSAGQDSIMESFPTGGTGIDLGIVTYLHIGGFAWVLL